MSSPVYILFAVLFTLAAGSAVLGIRKQWDFRISRKAADRSALVLFLTAGIAFTAAGLWKLHAMQYGMWDFCLYDSILHNTVESGLFMHDFRGPFDHFSLLLLILTPCYRLCDTPVWPVLLQAWCMAGGMYLFYHLARRFFRVDAFCALALAFAYLFNTYYTRFALFDFHAECLFGIVFPAALLAYCRRKYKTALLLLFLCIFCKEDLAVPVFGMGLWMLFRKKTRLCGVIAAAGSILAVVLILKVYFPYVQKMEYWHYDRVNLFAPTVAATLDNALKLVLKLFSTHAIAVMLSVLLPFAFLPLLNWKTALFLWFPTVAVQLISSFPHQALLMSHYSAAVLVVTPVAALWGLRTLRVWCRQKRMPFPAGKTAAVLIVFSLTLHLLFADHLLQRYWSFIEGEAFSFRNLSFLSLPLAPSQYQVMKAKMLHAEKFRSFAGKLALKKTDTVAVQNEAGLEFLRKCRVITLGKEKTPPDYVILDAGNFARYDSPELLNSYVKMLSQKQSGYALLFPAAAKDGILIFGKQPSNRL